MRKILGLLLALILCVGMIIPVAAATQSVDGLSELELQTIEEQSRKKKINTIVTTDGEHDDMSSMIRYLSMSNEFNTKALILTSSGAGHWTGGTAHYPPGTTMMSPTTGSNPMPNPTSTTYHDDSCTCGQDGCGDGSVATRMFTQTRWTGFRWLDVFINKYEEVYNNLIVHDPTYPTPDYFRSVYKIGNVTTRAEMDEITPGSEFMKKIILENPDGEPLHIQHWGGTNTTARALRSIKEEYEGTDDWERILEKINSEVTIYMIWESQAPTYVSYISVEWPGIRAIISQDSFFSFYSTYTQTQRHTASTTSTWFRGTGWGGEMFTKGSALIDEATHRNRRFNLRGTANANSGVGIRDVTHPYYTNIADYEGKYSATDLPVDTWGESGFSNDTTVNNDFYAEGDTPSYLFLVDNGLRGFENPSWGSWAGRFAKSPNPDRPNEWRDVTGTGNQNNGGSAYTPLVGDAGAPESVLAKNWVFSRWVPDIQGDYVKRAIWSVTDNFERRKPQPKERSHERARHHS